MKRCLSKEGEIEPKRDHVLPLTSDVKVAWSRGRDGSETSFELSERMRYRNTIVDRWPSVA